MHSDLFWTNSFFMWNFFYKKYPRYVFLVWQWLYNEFPDGWIRRRRPIGWPDRSPDLDPLDFSFEVIRSMLFALFNFKILKGFVKELLQPARLFKEMFLRMCVSSLNNIYTIVWLITGNFTLINLVPWRCLYKSRNLGNKISYSDALRRWCFG